MRTLDFLKDLYNLHGKAVEWAIIEERSDDNTAPELKPGLYIKGSRVYVDLCARRFFSTLHFLELQRRVYPARRVNIGQGCIALEAKQQPDIHITLSRTFIQDIYAVMRYAGWMEERLLL